MKTYLAFAVLGVAAVAAAGCVIEITDTSGDSDDAYVRVNGHKVHSGRGERLYGVEISDDIVIRAKSNGCTAKDFFEVEVDREGNDRFELTFHRVRKDYCDAPDEDGVTLAFTREELGLPDDARLEVTNPISR